MCTFKGVDGRLLSKEIGILRVRVSEFAGICDQLPARQSGAPASLVSVAGAAF